MIDTLIRQATIVDGTGSPTFIGDIGIANDRIVINPDLLQLSEHVEIIEANGLCLCPGFIDVHTHDDTQVIHSPSMTEKISQGVTTVIVGNCGISASPVRLAAKPPNPMNLLGSREDFQYPSFSSYVHAVRQAVPSVNVAALIGHTALRANHLADLMSAASASEVNAMREDLQQALAQGAIGMSSGLAYDSAQASSTDELKALVSVIAGYNGVYTTHLRSEFDAIIEALDEAFDTAESGGVPLIISHIKCAGAQNWGRSPEVIQHLQSKGSPYACDCYPYAASSSTLDINQVGEDYPVFITWSDAHPEQAGRYLTSIAEEWQLSLQEAARKLMPAGAVYHGINEEDVKHFLAFDKTMIGSDGLPKDPHPHPRLWGSFPRVLGHYCRELGLFDLPTAIHKMTGLSATNFRIRERGKIAENYYADLVLFDADDIADTATFSSPKQIAKGIHKVWVNGTLAFSEQQHTNKRNGRMLLREEI